jgi:rubredoxin
MSDRACPDCDVALERVDYSTAGVAGATSRLRIDDPRESGTLGMGGKTYPEAHLCRECGLVRFYAVT